MRERSVYSINQRRRLEAETTHEREERLQQLSDNQQRKLDTDYRSSLTLVWNAVCNKNKILISYPDKLISYRNKGPYFVPR